MPPIRKGEAVIIKSKVGSGKNLKVSINNKTPERRGREAVKYERKFVR